MKIHGLKIFIGELLCCWSHNLQPFPVPSTHKSCVCVCEIVAYMHMTKVAMFSSTLLIMFYVSRSYLMRSPIGMQ